MAPIDPGTGFWPDNRNKTARSAIGEKNDNTTSVAILKVSREMSDTSALNWITGWIDTDTDRVFDNDLIPEDIVYRDHIREGTSFSTELRLDITSNAYDWTIGVMYARDEKHNDSRVQAGSRGWPIAQWLPGGSLQLREGVRASAHPPWPRRIRPAFSCEVSDFELTSVAVFTDVTWHMSDRFDFTLGGRYTSDDVTNTFIPVRL